MSTQEQKRGGSGLGFVLGILCGIAVGVLLAILLAPQSGEATRERLSTSGDTLRKRYDDALEQGREAYGRAKDEMVARMKAGS